MGLAFAVLRLVLTVLWLGFAEAGLHPSPWGSHLPLLIAQDHAGQAHVVLANIMEVDEGKSGEFLPRLDDDADIKALFFEEIVLDHDLEFGSQRSRKISFQGLNLLDFVFLLFLGQEDLVFHVLSETVHGDEHGVGETRIFVRNEDMLSADFEVRANCLNAASIDQGCCEGCCAPFWFFWLWLPFTRFQDLSGGFHLAEKDIPNFVEKVRKFANVVLSGGYFHYINLIKVHLSSLSLITRIHLMILILLSEQETQLIQDS